jgi:hypothetical protein
MPLQQDDNDAPIGAAVSAPTAAPLVLPDLSDGGAMLQFLRSALNNLEEAQGGGADNEARGLLAQLEAQLGRLPAALSNGGARGACHVGARGACTQLHAMLGQQGGDASTGGGAGPLDLQIASQIDRCDVGANPLSTGRQAPCSLCRIKLFLEPCSQTAAPDQLHRSRP